MMLSSSEAAVLVAACAIVVAVLFGIYQFIISKRPLVDPPPGDVAVKITKKRTRLPATGIIVRGPVGVRRPGDGDGIFYLPADWLGNVIIIEDAQTGKTIGEVLLQLRACGMIQLVID